MQIKTIRLLCAASALTLLAMASAQAADVKSVTSKSVLSSASTSPFTAATSTPRAVVPTAADLSINVAGIASFDDPGSPLNTVRTFNLGANALVTGIGWNVNITAFSPSWLSELVVGFGNSGQTAGVNLTVGNGDDAPGTGSYSSGGVLALADFGLEFNVGADGILRVEFYEGFVDPEVTPNGIWNFGTLTVQSVSAVPEPATYGLMALGLLGVAGAAARRRQQG